VATWNHDRKIRLGARCGVSIFVWVCRV